MPNNCTRTDVCLFSEMKAQYESGYPSYQTDAAAIEQLRPLLKNTKVIMVLGTWCGDCKLQVPHFYRILDAAGMEEENIELVCVDRTKRDEHGRTEELEVIRIPTFIFMRPAEEGMVRLAVQDNPDEIRLYVEAGRIVESPLTTLEEDMIEILSQK